MLRWARWPDSNVLVQFGVAFFELKIWQRQVLQWPFILYVRVILQETCLNKLNCSLLIPALFCQCANVARAFLIDADLQMFNPQTQPTFDTGACQLRHNGGHTLLVNAANCGSGKQERKLVNRPVVIYLWNVWIWKLELGAPWSLYRWLRRCTICGMKTH